MESSDENCIAFHEIYQYYCVSFCIYDEMERINVGYAGGSGCQNADIECYDLHTVQSEFDGSRSDVCCVGGSDIAGDYLVFMFFQIF